VITKPQNVCVMRDIMCSGYVAGGNTRFFGEKEAKANKGVYTAQRVKTGIDTRLAFHDDAQGEYESMMAFCAPYGDGAKRDQVISITDRLLPWEVTTPGGEKEYFPGQAKGFEAARLAFSLGTIHYGEDVRATENMELCVRSHQTKAVCCHSRKRAPAHRRCLFVCAQHQPRQYEQRSLLRGPAPQVQPLLQPVPPARPRPGPLRPR
tara:strand:+ start:5239 stop:5859 length:621 start_codon:yes stop_codon:yes gene_type:complete